MCIVYRTVILQLNLCLSYITAYPVASHELSDREGNGDIEEQQQFLRDELRDTLENPPTMGHEDENITGAGRNG